MKAYAGSVHVLLSTVSGAADLDDYLSLLTPDGTLAWSFILI